MADSHPRASWGQARPTRRRPDKTKGIIDVVTLQTLARRTDIPTLTAGYGLVIADECHHVPAAAFEHAVKQIPARRWLGLTATPYRRDKLDDLITLQVGPERGGMGAKARAAAFIRLQPEPDGPPLLVVATGPYIGEGFDCPVLDTLFLAAPVAFKGRLIQYAGRILRTYPGKTTAEIHDYHDVRTGVLAASLAKRAPGYTSLGFPDPRRLSFTPSSPTTSQ